MTQPRWKTVSQFPTKLNVCLPYNPAITLLGIYRREMKTTFTQNPIHKCSQQLCELASPWKQPQCPSQVNVKLWYIYAMEYYSVKKEQTVGACNNVDGSQGNIMPEKKKKPFLKVAYCEFPFIQQVSNDRMGMENKLVARGEGRRKRGRWLWPSKSSIKDYYNGTFLYIDCVMKFRRTKHTRTHEFMRTSQI